MAKKLSEVTLQDIIQSARLDLGQAYMLVQMTPETNIAEMQAATGFYIMEDVQEGVPEQETVTTQPVKKEVNKFQKKDIDEGKLRACYDAGKSVHWLAVEFSVSDQTIINRLTKMGIYKTLADRAKEAE